MAPNLAESHHQLIHDMILSGSLTQVEMADVAGCSERTIRNLASNVRLSLEATRDHHRRGPLALTPVPGLPGLPGFPHQMIADNTPKGLVRRGRQPTVLDGDDA